MLLRLLLALLTGLILLSATGCDRPPPLSRLPADAVVLAFGDSLTYGTGAAPEEAYPQVLQGLLGLRVVNAGIPGETSDEGLARLPDLLRQHTPALVILCHGGNDLLRRYPAAETTGNLRRMIELVRANGAAVVLVGVPQPGLSLKPPPFYAELAEEFALPYEGKVLPDVLTDHNLKSDPIHPNAAGYRRLAEALEALILRAQAR